MSSLAPTLEAFFTDRLARQRQASPHTVVAYGDTFRLLLDFARRRTGKYVCRYMRCVTSTGPSAIAA